MASLANHPALWSCHLGRRWILGLLHPDLYAYISLQAVVEIVTNETTRALHLLAKQNTKMCNAIYQNHLALDYLLASERVCGKFNLRNFCLQIDDEGKVIGEITDRMTDCLHPHPDLERLEYQ
jgi:hypothetical protein